MLKASLSCYRSILLVRKDVTSVSLPAAIADISQVFTLVQPRRGIRKITAPPPPTSILSPAGGWGDATASEPVAAHAGCPVEVACLMMAIAVANAVQMFDGAFHPRAILWLLVAIAVALPLVFRRFTSTYQPHVWQRGKVIVIGIGLLIQFVELLTNTRPGSLYGPLLTGPIIAALGFAGFATLAGYLDLPSARRWWFPVVLLLHITVGLWILNETPTAHIDVRLVQEEGVRALLHGQNPFAITFPDVHHHPELYATGTVVDGIVHLGFCYPPLTLLLDVPGFLLGDFRYTNLACMGFTALLLASTGGRQGKLLATLLLFMPRTFFVLECGWTEPTVVLLLALVIWAANKYPAWLGIMVGLFLVSKQYLLFALAPTLLLAPGIPSWRRFIAIAVGVGAVVTLPIALIDFQGFIRSVFVGVSSTSLRMDALSFLPFAAYALHHSLPAWTGAIGFIMAAALTPFLLRSLPKNTTGYAAAIAGVYLFFFAFGKLAFCNYYYFVFAALICAATRPAISGHRHSGHATMYRHDPDHAR